MGVASFLLSLRVHDFAEWVAKIEGQNEMGVTAARGREVIP